MKHILLVVAVAACSSDAPEHPTYAEDVAPILAANCGRCHSVPTDMVEGRNCLRVDRWESADDPGICGENLPTTVPLDQRTDIIVGVKAGGQMILDSVLDGSMPKDGPALTDRQLEILERWRDDGFPKRATNEPPAITFLTPAASGATVDQSFDVQYEVTDPDGDAVTWSLGWKTATASGTFATGLPSGADHIVINTSTLTSGTYTLVAHLDDGSVQIDVAATGTLTVPAGRNATPVVTVIAPNGGESFYPSQTVTVSWKVDDDSTSLHSDVVAISGTTPIPIASNVASTPGQTVTASWNLSAVAARTDYKLQVTTTDNGTAQNPTPVRTASDTSDATFVVSMAPQQVSFASQIQPIFTASCTGAACHGNTMPQQGLKLTTGNSYAQLVGVTSSECPSTKRVLAGSPDQSYLVWKLQGSGACFTGSQMPKGAPLGATQLQLVRDWIANGAPNN